MDPKNPSRKIDYGFLALLLLLSALGVAVLWSASYGGGDGETASFASKQIRWILFGIAAMFATASVDHRKLVQNAYIIYGALLFLLLLVLFLGKISMGAQRWLSIGPLRVQPSEFMKIGMALAVAKYFAELPVKPPYGLKDLGGFALLAGAPVVLTALQPDLGTAILVAAVACSVTLFQGVRKRAIFTIMAIAGAAAPLFWSFLREYQKKRILVFLNPELDPAGSGYHIIQSKIAIGSGQILGKGYLEGTQSHLRFLPERHTDFIFAVMAEEWGFIGSLLVIALFLVLVLWGLDIAAKARDSFGRLLAVGVTSILFFHVFVNMGMVMGLLPVVGVPLPLFSYGGSSVLTTYIVAGILLGIRMRRFAN
ncbi:rod shape-determining protein RodA [bacterium]|nr:MAG: rod shape-determining protein RodA [bacterium]